MKPSRPEDWTRYLRNYTLTSFGRIFPENYDGAILDFWRQQLTDCDPEEVVDVCCGNGALCWIANEVLNQSEKSARITGVDFADINPFSVLRRDPGDYPAVRFIGNSPAEKLPFAAASIDLVISQYGIEYSDLNKSILEIARVLKPAGRMAFIMHDTNSDVVKLSTAHLEDMKTVLSFGIHVLALKLFDLGLLLRTPQERQASVEYRALIEELNSSTNEVREIVRGYDRKSPIHRYMNRIMSVFGSAADASDPNNRKLITAAGTQLHSFINKIEHLSAAALSYDAIADLVSLIEQAACTVILQEEFAYSPDVKIGTALVAVRNAN